MASRKRCQKRGSRVGGAKVSRRTSVIIAGVLMVIGGIVGFAVVAPHPDPPAKYYVSIGDSYAAGYRPVPPGAGSTSTDGFAYQLEESLRARQPEWQLVNFGCSGETTSSMTFDRGCAAGAGGPEGQQYPDDPQSVAAANFVADHRSQVGLVTIIMGGNDVLPCARESDPDRARTCAEWQVPKVQRNLDALLSRIRGTLGPNVPIVGAGYMNVFLADQLSSDPQTQAHAPIATILFRDYLNPALAETYQKYGALFVDTTALAGGYLPGTELTELAGRGTVPASVGRICALTYYCTEDDPHPNRDGHALIAREIEKRLAR